MAPEIVVNGRFLARRITGVERYGREILQLIGDSCRVERPSRNLNGGMGHFWEQIILPSRVNSRSILWSPANTGPLWVSNQVLTIQDLSPLEHPEWYRTDFAAWYRLVPLLCAHKRKGFPSPTTNSARARIGMGRTRHHRQARMGTTL